MSDKLYKCMIVKRIENNRLVTQHRLGEMYIALNESYEQTQKFLRSAADLNDAIERAKNLNEECVKFGLGCVIAECKKSGGQRQQIISEHGKSYFKKKTCIKGTTVWRVFLTQNGIYNVDENHKVISDYI